MDLDKVKKIGPSVDKRFLIALSGIVWITVGIILCNRAIDWLALTTFQEGIVLALTGVVLALLIHHFGFLRLVDSNIERILPMKEKVCIFAFQPWKSYMIIAIMVGLGIGLRHSPLPKSYLAVIYVGFGGAMILSSIRYIRVFVKLLLNPQ